MFHMADSWKEHWRPLGKIWVIPAFALWGSHKKEATRTRWCCAGREPPTGDTSSGSIVRRMTGRLIYRSEHVFILLSLDIVKRKLLYVSYVYSYHLPIIINTVN